MGSRAFCRASRTWDFDPPSNDGGFQGNIHMILLWFCYEKWWISWDFTMKKMVIHHDSPIHKLISMGFFKKLTGFNRQKWGQWYNHFKPKNRALWYIDIHSWNFSILCMKFLDCFGQQFPKTHHDLGWRSGWGHTSIEAHASSVSFLGDKSQ